MNRAGVLLLAMTVAGCGSTVAQRSALQDTGSEDAWSTPSGAAPVPTARALGPAGTEGTRREPGSRAAAGSNPSAPVSRPTSLTGGTVGGTLRLGVTFVKNSDAVNAAGGAPGVTTGDPKGQARAVADAVNASGGIAGRKVVLDFYGYDANSTQSYTHQDQAACEYFTRDRSVVAVLGGGRSDNLATCLGATGRVLISSSAFGLDRQAMRALPTYFTFASLTQDRFMRAQVAALQRLRYFGGWDPNTGQAASGSAKVGIVSLNNDTWERPLRSVLLPALSRLGHGVDEADIVRVHDPGSAGENGQAASDVQSAILRFRGSGVTHVLVLDANGGLTLLFGTSAGAQNYLPRLGLSSVAAPQALYDTGVLTKEQLNGSAGLGWWPTLDLPSGSSASYASDATRACTTLMTRAGFSFDSTNAVFVALAGCDGLWLLRKALADVAEPITSSVVRRELEAIGDSFAPATVPAVRLAPERHDGVQAAYDLAWSVACTCMRYVGAARDLG